MNRIAMRKYTIPQSMSVEYLLGDHLDSTSLTTDANGAKVSELRYKLCPLRYTSGVLRKGELRYTWTSAPATTPAYKLPSYTFTGQYSDSYINLLWYGSRHYDPEIGRFTSPDSIVPLTSQGVQAWDRYAYVNNSPVNYTDPTGHCIFCLFIPFVLSAVGATPDTFGIAITMAFTDTDDAVVAAGLSVQSQYPWAIVGGDAKGFAQASNDELENGQNPYSPSDAVAIMDERINGVVDACTLCKTPTDKLIVAALAQNYPGFNENTVTYLTVKDGQIDWSDVMTSDQFNNPQANDAKIRQYLTDKNYETHLMLKIYMQDLKVLMKLGYQLPDKYAGADFDYINNLIINPQTAGQQMPQ
jgi:RHS repeat-associated protein